MNWDAIGAIAELLGAMGVTASLIYLATQMRQNTRAMRAGAYQEVLNQRDSAMLPLMQDGKLAHLCSRGTANLDDLSEVEKIRFEVWIFTVMSSSDNIYYK
jgi:hypothetical protein